MNDLLCVIPLYGDDCENVSLRMISSIAIQKTKYDVTCLFVYDDTVSLEALLNVKFLLSNKKITSVILKSENHRSGYKRNRGIEYAVENNFEYIWFLDQDDFLLRRDSFDIVLSNLINGNKDCIAVEYSIPSTVNSENAHNLRRTITMPWMYIIKVQLIKDLRFNEEHEYGSDVPYTIRFLSRMKYISAKDNGALEVKNLPIKLNVELYYYNYLNESSHMFRHINMEDSIKQKEIDYAIGEIDKVKEEEQKGYRKIL